MFGIIGAMDQELKKFVEMIEASVSDAYQGFRFIEGKMKGKEIVVVETGIGRTAASVATTLLLEKYDAEAIINIGSCGAIDFTDRIGNVIVGDKIYYGDVDLTIFDYKYGQMAKCPPYFTSDKELVELTISRNKDTALKKGNIITFDRFVNDSDFIFNILDKHFADEHFSCVDMESAAIAHVCHIYSKPCLFIKVISDIVGSNSQDKDFYNYMNFISDKLAKVLYNLI